MGLRQGRRRKRDERGRDGRVESHSALVARFKRADPIVLGVPMWNFAYPYKLKQLIDLVSQRSMLFTYDGERFGPLLETPRAMVIYTRGQEYKEDLPTPPSRFDHQSGYVEFWLLICVGDPRKGGSRLSSLVLAWSLPGLGGRWGRCGVKVERPQRSEDERPWRRRRLPPHPGGRADEGKGVAISSHVEPPRVLREAVEGGKGRASAQPDPKTDGEWAGRRHPAEPGHAVLVWVWDHAAASLMTALPSRITMCWPVSACSWVARSWARRCLLIRDS
jgi:Flavodoxin-like fold